MRLIEPLGLLHGAEAASAVAAGLALPLAGGPAAFALARLIGDGPARLVTASGIPAEWAAERAMVTRAPPCWAGLPTDRPLIMGILNVTPDSFSDGGRHFHPSVAIAAGHAMVAAGADILDVGGESTRPRSVPISPEEEQRRVLPVIRELATAGYCISVDTRHAATMAAALETGARIVNDVSGLTHDAEAPALLARAGCPVVLMHMRGTPADMPSHAIYDDPAVEIVRELGERLALALAAGIGREAIAVDPGIGFAKHAPHSRDVLHRLGLLANLGQRVVLGVSRKSMIGQIGTEPDAMRRLPGSLAAGLFGLAQGAHILRVHDVAETAQAVRVWRDVQENAES